MTLVLPTYRDVAAAAGRLAGVAHETPVLTCESVNAATGATVFFKAENFQRTGSFKFRGAYNALAQLTPAQRQQGVITYSSGNHAQALAAAGRRLGVAVTVVMPQDAPAVKRAATEAYGAEVIPYDRATVRREVLGETLAAGRGLTLIPPYDHPWVIAGQGTAGRELCQQVADLDFVLVCCGGGGLLSGIALAVRALQPRCQVIGVEPAVADDATRSFYSGVLQQVENPDTLADGARSTCLGDYTFPLICQQVDGMVTVSETAILDAVMFLWTRLKVVVEPTGVLGAAALLTGQVAAAGRRVGVILSGGNADLPALARRLNGG
ncbi:MAG: threo-3-hydroxy-L-aspartate ammonia-lyase [Gloeomargaritaceae cyanobacterium C42_A2020_066]|nr:threo-3-hydroxy-L-aspartate ammonia-lyase [Gloeomargaritaceae cyanobacterium C42_A2020_066]